MISFSNTPPFFIMDLADPILSLSIVIFTPQPMIISYPAVSHFFRNHTAVVAPDFGLPKLLLMPNY
jgi:hypothetical protein